MIMIRRTRKIGNRPLKELTEYSPVLLGNKSFVRQIKQKQPFRHRADNRTIKGLSIIFVGFSVSRYADCAPIRSPLL